MRQAMIFAAGLGTRLKPLTDTMPKALVPVAGKPLLWHVVMKLRAAGFERMVVNVHHFASQIVDYLEANDRFGLDIRVSDERSKLLETGGGIRKAAPLFDAGSPVLIHNVDVLDNADYNWFSRQHLADEDAVLLVSRRKTKRYLLFDNAMRLMGWMNVETGEVKSPFPWLRDAAITIDEDYKAHVTKSSPVFNNSPMGGGREGALYAFAFSGIHSFSPRLFSLMNKFPERFPIMDFYLSTCYRANIVGLAKNDLRMMDVGKLDSLEAAEQFLHDGKT